MGKEQQLEAMAKRIDAALVRSDDLLVATDAKLSRYREALEKILNLTDSEMRDGDGARSVAAEVLGVCRKLKRRSNG